MDVGVISLIILVSMVFLLAIGMPLGFASGALAVATLMMKFGPDLLLGNFGTGPFSILAQRMYSLATDYVLLSVPLFIFMATLLERSGIARDMYDSLSIWLNRTRGGIAIVTSIMAVVMAAMSGIIGGEVVLLGLIALPQMLRLGYDRKLAIGTICASGSLGTMIPPSIVLIMYGLITETSISALFKGAFLPGFMMAIFYIVYIIVRTRLNHTLAPLPQEEDITVTQREKRIYGLILVALIIGAAPSVLLARAGLMHLAGSVTPETLMVGRNTLIGCIVILALSAVLLSRFQRQTIVEAWTLGKGLIAPLLVIFAVLGSIYGGVTGITEAAAIGAFSVLLLIILRREFRFSMLWEALTQTFRSTGSIIWVTFGATALAGAYTIAGGPTYVANLINGAELSTLGILMIMMVIFLFLGALMDWVGIVLLVMPVFLPIVKQLPVEDIGLFSPLVGAGYFVPVWFGILFCVNMQVSFLSPPFGQAAFFLKSVAPRDISLGTIFRSFLPFIAIQLMVLMLILFFPELTMVFA